MGKFCEEKKNIRTFFYRAPKEEIDFIICLSVRTFRTNK